MPMYAYRCSNGHQQEQLVKMDASDAPKSCSICYANLERVLSAPQGNFPGAGSWRAGMRSNR